MTVTLILTGLCFVIFLASWWNAKTNETNPITKKVWTPKEVRWAGNFMVGSFIGSLVGVAIVALLLIFGC